MLKLAPMGLDPARINEFRLSFPIIPSTPGILVIPLFELCTYSKVVPGSAISESAGSGCNTSRKLPGNPTAEGERGLGVS
jgi:hypothetical protein